eukprot:1821847-Rhodomonas_salina.1
MSESAQWALIIRRHPSHRVGAAGRREPDSEFPTQFRTVRVNDTLTVPRESERQQIVLTFESRSPMAAVMMLIAHAPQLSAGPGQPVDSGRACQLPIQLTLLTRVLQVATSS